MEIWNPTYSELSDYYKNNFSLAGLNTDISNKFAVISLVCFLTKELQNKNPDATCYKLIMAIMKKDNISDDYLKFIRGLSVICDDMMNHTTEFMTFDLKTSKSMIQKIHEILNTWMPF